MPLKYQTSSLTPVEVDSPLYGTNHRPPQPQKQENSTNFQVLNDPKVLDALKAAEQVYANEMFRLGYSPLTVGTYSSQVGRFIQFLEVGIVIPDREQ
jgi:hypothetical protein